MKGCVGQRTKKIMLQRIKPTASADSANFINKTDNANWEDYEEAFASVKSRGGREFWRVDVVADDVSHVWTIDWSTRAAAATPAMRLISEDVTYNVASVIDIDLAHEEIEIQTTRAVT